MGIRAKPSSVATITTGTVRIASVSDAHIRPGVPKVGAGSASGIEQLVDIAAEVINEEAQTEYAVDDGRHAGEVVHRDTDDARDRPLLGIFAQIHRGDHAERRHQHRHQHDHQHGAEDGRENAAFGVGLARIVGENSQTLCGINLQLGQLPISFGRSTCTTFSSGSSTTWPV